jgi:CubicO group peptidase (beta-lactamase class C family)
MHAAANVFFPLPAGLAYSPGMSLSPGPSVTALLERSKQVVGVAVTEQFGIAWSRVAGGADDPLSQAGDPLFQAGSISKPVAALVALELAARGQVDLDGDVNEALTSWHLPGSQPVSPRQLLGHTAGLGVPFYPGYAQGAAAPTLLESLDGAPPSVTEAVRANPALLGKFHYSGGAYAVVQQLVADVTGLPFAEAARSLVFEPLDMTKTTFEQPLPAGLHAAAARQDWHVYPESAAAGLWTTPGDLARFACALQAALAGRTSPVSKETAAQMLTRHTALSGKGEWNLLPLFGIRPPDSFGLGLFLHGGDRFSHFGGAHSFFSAVTGSTEDGRGAVVMTASDASPYIFKLLRAISDDEGWAGFKQPAWKRLHGLPGLRRLS